MDIEFHSFAIYAVFELGGRGTSLFCQEPDELQSIFSFPYILLTSSSAAKSEEEAAAYAITNRYFEAQYFIITNKYLLLKVM